MSAQDDMIIDEAVDRLDYLELFLEMSRLLDGAVDDYTAAVEQFLESCVRVWDLAAIQLVDQTGTLETIAFRVNDKSSLSPPAARLPVGRSLPLAGPAALACAGKESTALRRLRTAIGASSMVVAPITASGIALGRLILATERSDHRMQASVLPVAEEMAFRVGVAIQRVLLRREALQSAARQASTGRQLRLLAAAAAALSAPTDPETVLSTACREACRVLGARGAIAEWRIRDRPYASVWEGEVDEAGFSLSRQEAPGPSSRGSGWLARRLSCSDPTHSATLVVRAELSEDAESLFGSLAALLQVSFERALAFDTTVRHEKRLATMLDASPVALLTCRIDGSVVAANAAALELFGWSREDSRRPLPAGLTPGIATIVSEVLRIGRVDNQPIAADELELEVSGSVMPAGGADEVVILAVSDVRQQRSGERALLEAQRLEVMGQVAGAVAHDFNNLLTVIIGYTGLLEKNLQEKADQELVTAIGRAANRAGSLTKRLLGFAHRTVVPGASVDLGACLTAMRPVLTRVAGPGVSVEVVADKGIHVLMDEAEVEQVVLNLAINAVHAMAGRGRLAVRLEAFRLDAPSAMTRGLEPGDYVRLRVQDSGEGMDDATRARCLEPFFTTKPRGKGSGLGLSTVHAVVAERGGRVAIESVLGVGTSVTVELPRTEVQPGMETPGDDLDEPPALPQGTRVLLVEYEPEVAHVAASELRRAGASVVVAGTGEEAIDIALSSPPFDILITDVVLPGRGGTEVAVRVRTRFPTLPILLITAYAPHDPRAGWGPAPFRILHKPFRPSELRREVASVLDDQG